MCLENDSTKPTYASVLAKICRWTSQTPSSSRLPPGHAQLSNPSEPSRTNLKDISQPLGGPEQPRPAPAPRERTVVHTALVLEAPQRSSTFSCQISAPGPVVPATRVGGPQHLHGPASSAASSSTADVQSITPTPSSPLDFRTLVKEHS